MKKYKKTNISYIITILLAVIVYLLTVKLGSVNDVVQYIGFASSISSLILALVAIFYSFVSNASFSENIGRLDDASRGLTAASEAVVDKLNTIQAASEELKAATAKIDHVSGSFIDVGKSLRDDSSNLTKLITELSDKFEKLPTMIGSMEKNITTELNKHAPQTGPRTESTGKLNEVSIEQAREILRKSSITGVRLFYGYKLSLDVGKTSLIRTKMAIALGADVDYVWGYSVCAVAAGWIAVERKGDAAIIKFMSPNLLKALDELKNELVNDDLKRWGQTNPEDTFEIAMQRWQDMLNTPPSPHTTP